MSLRDVQGRLKAAGLYAEEPDGKWGSRTEAAVIALLDRAANDNPAPASEPVTTHGLRNSAAFFASLRGSKTFGGVITQNQVDGINILLAGCASWPLAFMAYGLATPFLETGRTMQPIRERGSGDGPDADRFDDYLQRYDTGPLAARLGNTPEADGDGVRLAGAGYVMITGHDNYDRAGRALGLPLLDQPELALRPDVAAQILRRGMEEGWFTGKKLADYLPSHTPALRAQFVQARRIINLLDRADDIAGYAMDFQAALQAGGWS